MLRVSRSSLKITNHTDSRQVMGDAPTSIFVVLDVPNWPGRPEVTQITCDKKEIERQNLQELRVENGQLVCPEWLDEGFVALESGNVLLRVDESGQGGSYTELWQLFVFEDIEDALEHAGDVYDEEHNRDDDFPTDADGCPTCQLNRDKCREEFLQNLRRDKTAELVYCHNFFAFHLYLTDEGGS
jgi:hypothetical protein